MNKGDKVRIKDTWGGPTSSNGFEAEVIEVGGDMGTFGRSSTCPLLTPSSL